MDTKIKQRVLRGAQYLIEEQSNVREVAKHLGCSKSTVHKDLSERLEPLDRLLYQRVVQIFDVNKREKHLRGGATTKEKYQKRHHSSSQEEKSVV